MSENYSKTSSTGLWPWSFGAKKPSDKDGRTAEMTRKSDDEAIAAYPAALIKRYPQGAVGTWEELKAEKNRERSERANAKRRARVASLSVEPSSGPEKAAGGSLPPSTE